ncbi:hypothetical protein CHX27_11990 [Flavobacterium aurantiibacter]|uniref:Uncharacterized protein n=1 Tax=Flavobacterium aurantiibacter TaxID=2023067 RepID=A0A255ZL45_9FLAO|nr:hypothetical protein CHX27_11990 [Flavobacterium aurantiibacter]
MSKANRKARKDLRKVHKEGSFPFFLFFLFFKFFLFFQSFNLSIFQSRNLEISSPAPDSNGKPLKKKPKSRTTKKARPTEALFLFVRPGFLTKLEVDSRIRP